MNLSGYNYEISEDFLTYEFYSAGPKGLIRKVVKFSFIELPSTVTPCVNLGFGDWNEEVQDIDDFAVSDNDDAEKVLATVAYCVLDFVNNYPGVLVFAEGSTPARTRMYQMGINKYFKEISTLFEIHGLVENKRFMPFQRGVNYTAFLAMRKEY